MELESDSYWCAVKGVTAADAVGRVYGPHANPRAPSHDETIRGGTADYRRLGMQMEHGRRLSACFVKGEWTFFLSPRDIFDVGTLFPSLEVFKTSWVARYSWSSVEHWANGAVDWSVYGSTEDDFVRTTGEVPATVATFTRVVTDCELAPLKVAHKVTGFRHDMHLRPRGFQIVEVEPPRELVVADGQRLKDATEAQVAEAVAQYVTTPGMSVALTVGATTLSASHVDGQLRVESAGCVARPVLSKRQFSALDVKRCFADFFDEGRQSEKYSWYRPA